MLNFRMMRAATLLACLTAAGHDRRQRVGFARWTLDSVHATRMSGNVSTIRRLSAPNQPVAGLDFRPESSLSDVERWLRKPRCIRLAQFRQVHHPRYSASFRRRDNRAQVILVTRKAARSFDLLKFADMLQSRR
jgi:hypothetical protein